MAPSVLVEPRDALRDPTFISRGGYGRWLCLVLLFCLAPALHSQSSAPKSRLDPFWDQWLNRTGPLLEEEERLFFRILESDLEREAFLDAFWASRGAAALERWSRNRADAERMRSLSPWRERAVLLAGKPSSIEYFERCGPMRSVEIWEWDTRERTRLMFVEASTLNKRSFTPWDPAEVESLSRGSVGYSTLESLLAALDSGSCFDRVRRARLLEALESALSYEQLQASAAWPRPGTDWLRELGEPGGLPGSPGASLTTSYLGRYTRFTIVRGELSIDVDRLQRLTSGRLFDRVVVVGDVFRGSRLVDTFQVVHLIAGAAPEPRVVVPFYRRLQPGTQRLRLRVADRHGLALLRVERMLDVPSFEDAAPPPAGHARGYSHLTREEVVQLHTFPGVELLPVVVKGTTRAQVYAATTGGPIAAVEFLRDGERVASDREPPYASSIEIGPEGNLLEAVALDPSGLALAGHQRRVEREGPPFAVRFGAVESRGEELPRAVVRISLPEGESVQRVECFHARQLIATPEAAPYSCPVPRATTPSLDYLTVRVSLSGGDVQEDVMFLGPRLPEEVDVRLVEFYVSVFNGSGRPELGLETADFQVREAGLVRPLERVDPMENLPLSVTVLLDMSSSMGRGIRTATASAQAFFESVLTEGDQASLIAFNHDLHVLAPFTADTAVLDHAATGLGAWGATRLYDAVVYALSQFSGVEGRRALVLLSDGEDVGSDYPFEQVVEAAVRAGVVVYPIAIARSDELLRDDLRVLARRTGGRAYAVASVGQLDSVYAQIEEELRAQYLLVYRPDRPVDFEPLDLEVEVLRPGLTTRELRRHDR